MSMRFIDRRQLRVPPRKTTGQTAAPAALTIAGEDSLLSSTDQQQD
jgi:hypothetical protein